MCEQCPLHVGATVQTPTTRKLFPDGAIVLFAQWVILNSWFVTCNIQILKRWLESRVPVQTRGSHSSKKFRPRVSLSKRLRINFFYRLFSIDCSAKVVHQNMAGIHTAVWSRTFSNALGALLFGVMVRRPMPRKDFFSTIWASNHFSGLSENPIWFIASHSQSDDNPHFNIQLIFRSGTFVGITEECWWPMGKLRNVIYLRPTKKWR